MHQSIDVLLPTCDRLSSIIMTLAGICGQSHQSLRVVIADQSERAVSDEPVVRSLIRIIEARGGNVEYHRRARRHGIAEQREFLLRQARARAVLFLDDDVYMEPWVIFRLRETLISEGCGFVGAFPAGLSFREDTRPHQQVIEYWETGVMPEEVVPEGRGWERAQLHRAANVWHVSQQLPADAQRIYKVAWVASCVLYDRIKLESVGGFGFWDRLPRYHSGEEVLVQNLLLRRYGGCAILPSGTYHAELPSTVLNAKGGVDGHALDLLPSMLRVHEVS